MPSRFLLLFILASAALPLVAGEQLLRESHRDVRNTEVRIESIFGAAAQQGALPFKITIRNNSGSDRVWNVQLNEGGYNRTLVTRWSGDIAVENGTEIVREVILPFAPNFVAYPYRNVEATFTTSGLNQISRSTGYQTNSDFPTLALSQALATRSLAKLDDIIEKKGTSDQRFGESFESADLSPSWRAYTGLDALLIDFKTWKTIAAGPKRGIIEWVRTGGNLHIFYATKDHPEFSGVDLKIDGFVMNPGQSDRGKLSLGNIEIKEWDGKELPDSIVRDYENLFVRSDQLDSQYRDNWELADRLGEKPFNSLLIFGILLTFAILVAPVNLFYLAGKGRRHRLFYTTPIISVAACLIIMAIIFIGDGLGGKGYRAAFVDLQAGKNERKIYVTQEQLSRTGVIIETGFEGDQDLLIEPVRPRDSVFAAFNRQGGRSTTFHFGGRDFGGGFFRSRSEQGFALKAVEPTRARIEMQKPSTGNLPPGLVSSLPSGVGEFYFRDAEKRIWKSKAGTATEPGGTFQLEAGAERDLSNFVNKHSKLFSSSLGNDMKRIGRETNRFYALPTDPSSFLLKTHPGIRWTDDFVLLTGTLTTSAEPESNTAP